MNLLKHKNNINDNAKKTMNQRLISSIFMTLFIIFMFILGILSDKNWSPIISDKLRSIPAFLLIILLIPLIYISAIEINNIYFKFKKIPLIVIFINMFLLIIIPTLCHMLVYYDFLEINIIVDEQYFISGIQLTNLFAIILFSFIIITIISLTLLLYFYYSLNLKNWIIFCLITLIISGFFLGLFFVIFTRNWTTLLYLVLITIGMDSFAYFGGLFFGKHKMAPKISPKKTWEGFIIGLIITMILISILLIGYSFIDSKETLSNIFGVEFKNPILNEKLNNNLFSSKPEWWISMFFINLSLCIVSVLGDLCFSWFKRKYKIKDFGNLIKGHGGFLDRIDSHAFVLSSFFAFSFIVALFAKTVVFFG